MPPKKTKLTPEVAFPVFFQMGSERSITKLRDHFVVNSPELRIPTHRAMQMWSAKYNWPTRISAMEAETTHKTAAALVKTESQNRVKHIAIASKLSENSAERATRVLEKKFGKDEDLEKSDLVTLTNVSAKWRAEVDDMQKGLASEAEKQAGMTEEQRRREAGLRQEAIEAAIMKRSTTLLARRTTTVTEEVIIHGDDGG